MRISHKFRTGSGIQILIFLEEASKRNFRDSGLGRALVLGQILASLPVGMLLILTIIFTVDNTNQ